MLNWALKPGLAHGAAEGRARRWGGFGLALLAAALLALSTFMPKLHYETIQLRENRLIGGWEGIALTGCAALAVLGAALGLRWKRWGWLDCVAGAAALSVIVYASTGSRLIVQEGGALEGTIYGVPGIGLLTAGLGALVAIGAGLMIGLARDTGSDGASRWPQVARP
jgi:hypothetical protein